MKFAKSDRAIRRATVCLWSCSVAGLLVVTPGFADNGSFLQSTFVAAKPDSSRYDGKDLAFQLTLGQDLTPRLGWFASYQANEFVPADGGGLLKQRAFDLGANVYWGKLGPVRTYSPAALGIVDSQLGDERRRAPSASLGLGYTVPIPWVPNLQVVNEFRGRYSHGNPYASEEGTLDAFGALGLKYNFSAAPQARKHPPYLGATPPVSTAALATVGEETARRPAPVSKNRTNQPDVDEDTVNDSLDRCPNTVYGVRVDADGCAI